MSAEAKPVPVPTCAYCGMLHKPVNIVVLGMVQPQIQPALMIPPGRKS
jgi:hypothetical protein